MSNWRILIVEDDPYSQEVIARMLEYSHFSVEVTGDAPSALKLLAANTYALAIIDLGLPEMDGWQLLQRIQDNPRTHQLPCVAVTAYHDAVVAHEAMQAGFAAYFAKPLQLTFARDIENVLSA